MVKPWMKLVRIGNVLLVGVFPIILHFVLLKPYFDVALSSIEVIFLSLSLMFIGAAGNTINDIYDVEADKKNKPEKQTVGVTITTKQAYRLYLGLFFTGWIISFGIEPTGFSLPYWVLYLIPSVLLWLYSSVFKGTVLIGNVIISAIVSMNVFIVLLLDIVPIHGFSDTAEQTPVNILESLSIFAFMSTLARETVKDVQDKKGDTWAGYRTLGTVYRTVHVKTFITLLLIMEWFIMMDCAPKIFPEFPNESMWVFWIIFIPLAFMAYHVWMAITPKQYGRISTWMKVHLLLGLIVPISLYILFVT